MMSENAFLKIKSRTFPIAYDDSFRDLSKP